MKIKQIYTNCLAEAAYYIESNGEVAIIDPLRETQPYTEMAQKNGAKIKYILETHFHADFVSGHLDLAKKTGAKIVYGPTAQPQFEAYIAKDAEELTLGNVKIKVLHTPGHTMESSTFLLIDENGNNHAIFTGDTLFIGDVGRPDLAVKTDLSIEDLAGHLYNSLRNKIMPLADDLIVYPGHGAGSACGKNMSKETTDTLGNQKVNNYALQVTSKEEFVKVVTEGLLPPPQYFPKNAVLNKTGYESIDEVMTRGYQALSLAEFEAKTQKNTIILDTRNPQVFNKGFIPNALNVGLDGMFAVWVGTFIKDLKQEILLLCEEGRAKETVLRLARVGYDNVVGFLAGGFKTWQKAGKPVDTVVSISANELAKVASTQEVKILDVRKPSEYIAEHIIGANNYPVEYLSDYFGEMNPQETYYVHCAGGYRSMIASSILKTNGFKNIIDIAGGFKEIVKTDISKSDYVCPSELV